jgi:outer membrane receptor protein involved in Fe transport
MTMRFQRLFFSLVFLTPALLNAGTTGKISGRVIDSSTRDGLPGASVVLEGTKTGASTDTDGYYTIINILPGTYSVSLRAVGYAKTTVREVEVSSDRTTKVDITATSEEVTMKDIVVQAERPPIQRDKTYSGATVGSQAIEAMPVTTVAEVISQQAGVVSAGGELHFRGGRGREVAYLIDGIPVSNAYNQGGGNEVPVENSMVQEIAVLSGTFNAEYGSAQSGVVNIVTRPPARTLSGSVTTYAGDWVSSRDNVFLGIKKVNPLAERDVQVTLSGPLLIENLGFFVSGRHNESESPYWYQRRFMPLDGTIIAAYDHWFREHNPDIVGQTQAIRIDDSLWTGDRSEGTLGKSKGTTYTGKLEFQATGKLKLGYQVFGSLGESIGGSLARRYQPDEQAHYESNSVNHIFALHHFPSENFFYSLGFSYQHNTSDSYYRKDNRVAQFPGDAGIQLIGSTADGFSLGNTAGFYTGASGKNYRNVTLVNGDFNWQVDRYNLLKAGFEFKQHDINTYSWPYISTIEWENYQWPTSEQLSASKLDFWDYWTGLVGYWKNWQSTHGTTQYRRAYDSEINLWRDYTIRPQAWAVYLQDKLELGEIIVNAGLRVDGFKPRENVPILWNTASYDLGNPANLKKARNKMQLSPRFGLSFPISDAGAFHAAYGHFFQMPSFQYMYNTPVQVLTALQLEGMTLGNADLEPEKTISYEIGLQQEITAGLQVDVTAYYKDFRNLLGIEQITTTDAVGYQRFINRDYGYSKGITITLKKSGGLVTGALNYSLSFANGSSSDPTTIRLINSATQYGGQSAQFIERQILPLDWDQRHTLNAFVDFARPGDWNIGIYGYISTGLPYSPTFIERFDILTEEYRQSGDKPARWGIDLKAMKYFEVFGNRLGVFLKVDNVFDHLNEESVFASTGRATSPARLPDQRSILLSALSQEGLFTLNEIDNHPDYYSQPRKVTLGLEWRF